MKNIQNIIICSLVSVLLLTGCEPVPPERLTSEQIAVLREDYHVVPLNPVIEYPMTTEVCVMPIMAEIEIYGLPPDYKVNVDSKPLVFRQIGATVNKVLYNRTGAVIEDEIIIGFAFIFNDYYPTFASDQRYIAALEPASGPHEGKYIFEPIYSFYITRDDLVISITEGQPDYGISGMKLKDAEKTISEQADK